MSDRTASAALKAAICDGLLGPPSNSIVYEPGKPQHAAVFYDLDEFEAGLDRAKNAFGEGFLHAMAIKSNPLSAMMKIVLEKAHGVECASIGEVLNALHVGFPSDKIVFDSPVKTKPELRFALEQGIHINADNYQELDVITEIMRDLQHSKSTIGIRLNPVTGSGEIQALSVCTFDSKFGVQLTESSKEEIIRWYIDRPWLTGVHVHAGSQSFDCSSLTHSIKRIVDFALEVNHRVGKTQVDVVDIGGGLKVNTEDDTHQAPFEEYAKDLKVPRFAVLRLVLPNGQYTISTGQLQEKVPELFPNYGVFKQVITEFGSSLNTKPGWLASRVEYTKMASESLRIALIHFGADIMLRTCYWPNVPAYQRRIQVFDSSGNPKEGEKMHHNIAGPLCFSGDILKRDVLLPVVDQGDYIVIHDCGANSLALFSRHCSRQAPSVIGYRVLKDGKVNFQILKEAETMEDVLKFWQGGKVSKTDE